jgi:ABC-type Mn2+/Zn2+ transport system permease subunit/Mn-dependent DtxR family transcriptional regulator
MNPLRRHFKVGTARCAVRPASSGAGTNRAQGRSFSACYAGKVTERCSRRREEADSAADRVRLLTSAATDSLSSSSRSWKYWILLLLLAAAPSCFAVRIGEMSETTFTEQITRFFTFRDPALRYALIGSVLLGVCCGLLGSFLVVRKMALVGDALSHAVLPGVAMGFLWNMNKDPWAIFIGATVAGILGAIAVHAIKQTTLLKEDTALGLVLAAFFAVGIVLLTMIQQLPQGNKSGIDKFLFGQAAAISQRDVVLMSIVTGLALLSIFVFYKEFLVTSFDPGFARSAGFAVQAFHYALMLLLAFAVVIALQAVGVVLVSAMLITPAAAAYMLTDRMHRMLWLAALFGVFAGASGAFFSFLRPNLPTGPFMVLGASSVFTVAFLFGPKHGVIVKWSMRRSRSRRIQRENTLKAIYHVLEARSFHGEGVTLNELAQRRRETIEQVRLEMDALRTHGFATMDDERQTAYLTPDGWQRALSIVRNHRLWELYLTHAAQIAPDHVHEDAEKIEHVLGEDVVRELERKLDFARRDPHGRVIPSVDDLRKGVVAPARVEESVGYGRRA